MIGKNRIFLVEDDLNFGSVMKSYLEMNDFVVDWVNDGKHAVASFSKGIYDMCILDVMLPHVDGFTIGTEIKKLKPTMSIIFLTAKTLKEDMIKGFTVGADDYVTKPFDSDVLIYKIKAILKRNQQGSNFDDIEEDILIGNYTFDYKKRNLKYNDEEGVKLSPKEAELLLYLSQNINRVLDRNFALDKIWGEQGYFTARSMDVYITKLRKFLKADSNIEIVNIHGSGYILKVVSE
ncbi:MAG: response regulator transcription factor [Salinivirgaceae bacterium]|nr:response regulator transcription factor [Salinivirgaceae bacterium]